jgi:hypothetical protein
LRRTKYKIPPTTAADVSVIATILPVLSAIS